MKFRVGMLKSLPLLEPANDNDSDDARVAKLEVEQQEIRALIRRVDVMLGRGPIVSIVRK
ncbi:MAG TPA: hypothetical protein VMI75_32215 [Polyangiaceae bacterium]|nr:hypothetical protein [Polyangiaceae bacterium]